MSSLSEDLLSENDIEAVLAAECCYDYVLTLQRRLKKSLQIKKIITNPPWVLSQILISSIIAKKIGY